MAPKRRNLSQAIQDNANAGQVDASSPQKRPRYGYRAVVTTSSSSPSAGPRMEAADLPAEKDQPQRVEGQAAEQVEEEPDRSWRHAFRYQGHELLESDSIYRFPSVAATIMLAAQKFMMLDDRMAVMSKNQNEALTHLDLEKKRLNEQLKEKKKELNTANGGYDICFEESVAEVKAIKTKLYQAGYDRGLDAAQVPPMSDLRVPVIIPTDFQYVVEAPAVDAAEVGQEAEGREVVEVQSPVDSQAAHSRVGDGEQDGEVGDRSFGFSSLIQWLVDLFASSSIEDFSIVAMILWSLWKRRNEVVWNAKNWSNFTVVRRALDSLSQWSAVSSRKEMVGERNARSCCGLIIEEPHPLQSGEAVEHLPICRLKAVRETSEEADKSEEEVIGLVAKSHEPLSGVGGLRGYPLGGGKIMAVEGGGDDNAGQ
ncbi:hypothetical protein LguiB_006695 [Lonicera macranthoides]